MDHEIRNRPAFAAVDIELNQGESIMAEAGAMVSHTDGIDIRTDRGGGGLLQNLKRSILGGESFFRNTFTADRPGTVTFAPPLPGDVVQYDLDGTVYLQSGSYLAASPEVDVDTKFGGGRTFFGGEGLFLLKCSGRGPVFMSSYGAVEKKELRAGERFTVDTGHIVAFEDGVTWDVRKVGGLKSTLFSGEGLVCDMEGPGTVWVQSRSPDAFVSWLVPHLPTRETGNGGVSFEMGGNNFGGGGGRGGNV
ncbi:TIGR00266 family protein [Halorubellus sp. JP-L1]|uniref:TIGR00266 family protein n=1 Tax=Halorubellus sp. JP-L1 TaxID=2715753 RepID=UPI00140CD9CD|nr:TIGR00266 family protein [Halorubellus sp. JP-L1]NHN42104.1 TIGR00266 family protein [Halorubellus sp. JP-L1]